MLAHLVPLVRTTLRDRKGVTAAEYAILAVGLVAAVGAAVASFGPVLTAKFTGLFGS